MMTKPRSPGLARRPPWRLHLPLPRWVDWTQPGRRAGRCLGEAHQSPTSLTPATNRAFALPGTLGRIPTDTLLKHPGACTEELVPSSALKQPRTRAEGRHGAGTLICRLSPGLAHLEFPAEPETVLLRLVNHP